MESAQIAAKTMNNYLLFEKLLKCNVVEDRSRYDLIFKRCKRLFKFSDNYKKFALASNMVFLT